MCPALFQVLETQAGNKTDKTSCLHGACILEEGRDSGQDKQWKSVECGRLGSFKSQGEKQGRRERVGITIFTQVAREVRTERWHLKRGPREVRDQALWIGGQAFSVEEAKAQGQDFGWNAWGLRYLHIFLTCKMQIYFKVWLKCSPGHQISPVLPY